MTLNKPYRRIVRPGIHGSYTRSGLSQYIKHPAYAKAARTQIRSYLLLEKDLHALFDYIEPADANEKSFSMRNLALLVRACIQFETHAKSILQAHKYLPRQGRWNIGIYGLLETSHHLSSYRVKAPDWHGKNNVREPFKCWSDGSESPPWWKAYNGAKHEVGSLEQASFGQVVDAVCACLILITGQFLNNDFSGGSGFIELENGVGDGFDSAVGGYFRVKLPTDFIDAECYGFEPSSLEEDDDPFDEFNFESR